MGVIAPSLPPLGAPLLGRDALLAHAQEHLSRLPGLLTLVGAGGIGKTRLAWELLRHQARERSAWFCDLRAVDSAQGVVAAVAARVAPAGREPAASHAELVADLTVCPDALLVLDNFEQLLSASSTISAFYT